MNSESLSKPMLVVDDDAGVLGFLAFWLENKGYQVETAENGKTALEKTDNGQFLGVLLDLGLPDIKGLEVLEVIKKKFPALPVIMVTGHHDEAEARTALRLGALDYITKPVNFDHLERILEMHVASPKKGEES